MDEKEVKTRLKSAKESMQKKNFNEALKICEGILKAQPSNYMALVFAGRCHVELNNATAGRECYTRATGLDESQLLAWQGLHQFYEKYSLWDENSVSCLKQLVKLTSDGKKKRDYQFQLATTLAKAGRLDESTLEFSSLKRAAEDGWKKEVEENVVKYLGDVIVRPGEQMEFVKECFQNCIVSTDEKKELQMKYSHFLVQNRCHAEAYELFGQLGVSKDYGATFLCDFTAVLCERYIRGVFNEPDEETLEELEECFESDELVEDANKPILIASLATSALLDAIKRDWAGVVESLSTDQLKSLKSPFLWYLLAEAKWHLHDYIDAASAAQEARSAWQDELHKFHSLKASLIEANVLLEIGTKRSLEKALGVYQGILTDGLENPEEKKEFTTTAMIGLVLVCAAQGSGEKALHYLDKLPDKSTLEFQVTKARMHFMLKEYDECQTAVDKLENMVDEEQRDDISAMIHYLKGRILWDKDKDKARAFKEFMQTVKFDAYHADAFYYIGQYYDQLDLDTYNEKAVKCLERAYSLSGRYNYAVGCALSDVYRKTKSHQKNLSLLLEITESQPLEDVTWAWLRLGLEYLSSGKADDAVRVLQTILRLMNNDVRCWECLGEAYAMRGSYQSALKAFEKATELETNESSLVYANYRAASVLLIMNRYEQAVEQFRRILRSRSDHLPSLIGLGQSLQRMAESYFNEGRFQRSLDVCVQAVNALIPTVTVQPHCPSAWYLLGLVCTRLGRFPSSQLNRTTLKVEMVKLDTDFNGGQLDIFKCGSRCFAQTIALNSKIACVWHDLGMNLYFQSTVDEVENVQLLAQCLECLKHAIQLDPSNWRFWLSLGNAAASSYADQPDLAQHCYIKSLSLEPHQPAAWTGIGMLYKKYEEVSMAHKCFQRAQGIDPDYMNCWIGQAVIAEQVQPTETMDLFRHAVELGNNAQGSLGYGYHVLRYILDPSVDKSTSEYNYTIHHLRAIPMALVALQNYCWMNLNDACALNLFGLLLEQEGMISSSSSAYLRALELLKKSDDEDLEELVSGNACRVFGKLKNSSMMRKLAGRMKTKDTLENSCMRGLAYYRLGQFDKADQLYSEALYGSETTVDDTAIHCALALVHAKQNDWSKCSELMKGESVHSYAPLVFLSSISSLLEKSTLDKDRLRHGFKRLSELKDGAMWQTIIAAVCSVYRKAFTLPTIQWLLHSLPYDSNIRDSLYRIWKGRGLDLPCEPNDQIVSVAKWQALCRMKEDQKKELTYAKIKHQYPDMFRGEC